MKEVKTLKVFINLFRKTLNDFFERWPQAGLDFQLVQGPEEQDFVELLSGKWKGMKYGYGTVRFGDDLYNQETLIRYTYGIISWPSHINTPEKRIATHDDPEFKKLLGDIAVVLLNTYYKNSEVDSGWKKI